MKTSILKWDLHLQLALAVIDFMALSFSAYAIHILLLAQFFIGAYQLCSSGVHLLLQHKSIGFFQWRVKHFWGSLVYLIFLIALVYGNEHNEILWFTGVILVPQAILFAYILLCKKELDFIEEREFHILK